MGTFSVEFAVHSPIRNHAHIVLGLVDTGATYTTIPEEILEELGIERERTERFSWPDGTEGERDLGFAELEMDGKEGFDYIAFGSDPDIIIIGRQTLIHMAAAADAGQKCLIPGAIFG